jgi:MFS family permease
VGLIGLTAVLGAPLGGFLSDFWHKKSPRGRMYVPAVAYLAASVLIVLAIPAKFSPLGFALLALWGIAVAMAIPAFATVSQELVPVAHKGLAMGLVIFAQYLFGGAWGTWVVGGISDLLGGGADGLGVAVMLSAVMSLVGGIFFLIAARTYPADAAKVNQETVLAES